MPVRSPLTAATRQCSRRPARHVVIRSQFSPTAFQRFDEPLVFVNETALVTKHHRGRQRGRFFRAKAQKKNRTGWSAKACLHDSRNANTFGWWAKACLHRKVRKPITLNGFLNSSPRIKRLTQRRRHIHPYPLRVARNQREHHDGGHIRQHAQKLTRYF